MNFLVKRFLIPAVLLIVLDVIYFQIMRRRFENQVIQIQRTSLRIKPWGAVGCYLLLTLGIYYFILMRHRPIEDAFLLGVLIYGVTECTGYALFKNWDPLLMAGDTLWGGLLFAIVTWASYQLN